MRKSLVLGVCVILSLFACGGSNGANPAAPQRLRFMVIPKAIDLPVFNYAKVGAERQAKEYGNVDIIWSGPTSADQLKQKEILESAITQKVDGIAISTLNGDFLTETINKAMDAGIPVVTWDSDAPKSKRIAFYGVDDFKAGQILAAEAIKLLGGKGRIAMITSLGAYNLQRRLEGVNDGLKAAPGIKVVETFDIKEDSVRAQEIMASATNRYGDLDAWISVGGWPVFTRNALAPVPKSTFVVAFDTIQPAPELLKEGKVQILIGQKYFGWGEEPVKLLANIKAGKMPAQQIIDSGIDIVRQDNVDEYVANFKKLEEGK
jgi:ribose transport system substrate-binding protein